MTQPKTIAFRPTQVDQALIDAIQLNNTGDYKNTTELMRAAIQQLALVSLDQEQYVLAITNGYETEVVPSSLLGISKETLQ